MASERKVNLFNVPPRSRDYSRETTEERVEIMRHFGREYFDDPAFVGYGGYNYNGMWRETALSIAQYFELPDNARILDVGCAKGFLLYDFKMANPTFQVHGVDVSEYAIDNAMPLVKDNLTCTSCAELPADDASFDLVISVDVLQQLEEFECRKAVREINRVGRNHRFVSMNSYTNETEKSNLARWEPALGCLLSVDEWTQLLKEENYTGHYWLTTFV